jgi:hypothetical protein
MSWDEPSETHANLGMIRGGGGWIAEIARHRRQRAGSEKQSLTADQH